MPLLSPPTASCYQFTVVVTFASKSDRDYYVKDDPVHQAFAVSCREEKRIRRDASCPRALASSDTPSAALDTQRIVSLLSPSAQEKAKAVLEDAFVFDFES